MNELGYLIIKSFEGCKLKAYRDAVGILTIGYGDTHGVHEGLEITQAEADSRLKDQVDQFESGVKDMLEVSINDNQLSALICFAYNEGLGRLKSSHLLIKVNAEDSSASLEFSKWVFAGGKVLPGLVVRRRCEAALYCGDESLVHQILGSR